MDDLYLFASKENLSILPLVINPRSLFPVNESVHLDQDWRWYLSLTDRLNCDTVVAGSHIYFEISRTLISPDLIASTFDRLARQYLILQVPMEEISSSSVFQAIKTALEPYFPVITVLEDRDPDYRLLWCAKKPHSVEEYPETFQKH